MEDFFKSGAEEMLNALAGVIDLFNGIINSLFNIPLSESEIVDSAVTSAGVSLTSLFLLMEFFSQITSKWFERMEDAIQLGIKMIVAKIIIENSSLIVGGICSFFRELGTASIDSGLTTVKSTLPSMALPPDGGAFGLGYAAVTLAMYAIIIVAVIMFVMVSIEVAGIVFEIGIHMAVGPIALSTLCNSTFRSTGLSYIKSLSAVCLQTTVIGAIFTVYAKVAAFLNMDLGGAILNNTDGLAGLVFGYFGPLIGLAILCITVKKSSDITKRMFGA